MKILETIHDKKRYYLVFDGTDIVYKTNKLENAKTFINQKIKSNESSKD